MFVVYYLDHVDCYKRADSDADIVGVYINEEKAYENAFQLQIKYLIDYDCIIEEDNVFFNDTTKTYKEKYDYIHHDSYNRDRLFGEPEFTMKPTSKFYFVKEIKNFSDSQSNEHTN